MIPRNSSIVKRKAFSSWERGHSSFIIVIASAGTECFRFIKIPYSATGGLWEQRRFEFFPSDAMMRESQCKRLRINIWHDVSCFSTSEICKFTPVCNHETHLFGIVKIHRHETILIKIMPFVPCSKKCMRVCKSKRVRWI